MNVLSALLNGPDNRYKEILFDESLNHQKQCKDKNSFLQISVRSLNVKQQKHLLKKQAKRYYRWIKKHDKSLHLTFPLIYSKSIDQSKSSLNILFNNDEKKSQYKTNVSPCQSTNQQQKSFCYFCHSQLSNGICSCIVQQIIQLNNDKQDNFLVELNDIFEHLTSNNIIT